MAKLVIFDVDGTLVKSVKVDTLCFVQSIEDLFGIKNIDTRWHRYKTATDSGIFEDIFEKAFSRKPTSYEIHRHIERFTKLLKEQFQEDKNLFKEVPGSQRILAKLKVHPTWKAAIATGGWRKSTVLKLSFANIDFKELPFVTASDEKIREDIVRKCINNSKKHYALNHFDKIVSVGDTTWDIRTAYNLKIGFVGLNEPSVFSGVNGCLSTKNYNEYEVFMTLLENATIPDIEGAV
jgi:phosphoglycolate phosphatase-like HAD superfamily hydrolase